MSDFPGKGSRRRPRDNQHCTREQYEERFENVFGNRDGPHHDSNPGPIRSGTDGEVA